MSQTISIAPHLQRALDAMSKDMAVEPQALVNQAVFAWLRINGYVLPGAQAAFVPSAIEAAPAPVPIIPGGVEGPVSVREEDHRAVHPDPSPAAERVNSAPSTPLGMNGGAPAAEAPVSAPAPVVDPGPALKRMAEIDADLEKLTKPWPPWAPVQEEEEEAEEEGDAPDDEASQQPADEEPEEEQQEEQENEEPAAAAAPPEAPEEEPANTGETDVEEPPADSTIVLRSVPISLYLEREGEEPIKVTAERFIIGRGPHCDLVIDSPRVSREHVALTRSGILYFIEDLNSSNGTWFGEERVTKRELESGDVINLGNEPVTFFLRGE